MPHSPQDRCLALAGLFQAAALVDGVARHAPVNHDAILASLRSLFFIDAESVGQVFGGAGGVTLGLETLRGTLASVPAGNRREITRYVINLLHLSRRLRKYPRIERTIGAGISELAALAESLGADHASVVSKLADLYRETVSRMGPRIIVHGEPHVLADEQKAALVRALLLCGVRAAVLWYQCGGNRLQILLSRKSLLREATRLLTDS